MLIQFDSETSGRATGDCQPGRSHMRDGASRNPAIQLRPDRAQASNPVAWSRVEENDQASFLSRCCAALIDIAAVFAVVFLVLATGVGITFAGFVLLFCSL